MNVVVIGCGSGYILHDSIGTRFIASRGDARISGSCYRRRYDKGPAIDVHRAYKAAFPVEDPQVAPNVYSRGDVNSLIEGFFLTEMAY